MQGFGLRLQALPVCANAGVANYCHSRLHFVHDIWTSEAPNFWGLLFLKQFLTFEHRVRPDDGTDAAQDDLFVRCLFVSDVCLITLHRVVRISFCVIKPRGYPKNASFARRAAPSQILWENPRSKTRLVAQDRGD